MRLYAILFKDVNLECDTINKESKMQTHNSWNTLALCLVATVTLSGAQLRSGEKEQWEQRKAETIKNPDLLRYYVFEEGYGEEARNLAKSEPGKMAMSGGPQGSLYILRNNSPYGLERLENWPKDKNAPPTEWTEGRWPWKSALTNGLINGLTPHCVFRSGFCGKGLDSFTIEAWLRIHEMKPKNPGCLIFNIGDFYPHKDGLKANYANGRFEFHVGSPSGGKAVSAPLSEGVWHQVACGFDSGIIRLFVDGKLAGETSFDGPYVVPEKTKNPFIETLFPYGAGFFSIGGRRTSPPSGEGRFDIDELAIFKGLLSDADVERRYLSGKPATGEQEQLAAFRQLRERTERLAKLDVSIPKDTWGYFPNGKDIPVTVTIPKGSVDGASCAVELALTDLDGKQIWNESKTLPLEVPDAAVWETKLHPALNGVYFLDAQFKDASGKLLKRLPEPYCIGVTSPVPPREQYSPDHPLLRWWFPEPWDYGIPFISIRPNGENAPKAGTPPFPTSYITIWPVYDKQHVMDDQKTTEMVLEAVEKQKDTVFAWNLCCEPDGNKVTTDDYMKFLKICHPIIREKCPGALIVAPNVCPSGMPYLKELMRQGAWKYFDVLSFHDYQAFPIHGHRVGKVAEELKRISKEFAGKEMPMWNTESCFLNLPRIGTRPMTWDEARRIGFNCIGSDKGKQAIMTSVPTLQEDVAPARLQQQVLLGLTAGFLKYGQCAGPSSIAGIYETNSSGLPNLTGVGLAALSTILNPIAKAEELPLASLDDACVIITAKDGKRTAALFSDREPTLHFVCPPDHEFKGIDTLGNPLSFKSNQNGLLRLTLGEKPIFLFDVPVDFREAVVVKLAGPNKLPDNSILEGKVTVANPFKTALRGELSLLPLEGATLSLGSNKIELASGQSAEIPFKLVAERLKRKSYRIDCQLKDGDKLIASGSMSFDSDGALIMVPEMTAPFKLDGDENKWKDVPAQIIRSEDDVVHGKPNLALIWLPHWNGPDDLSLSVQCAWRPKEGIYVLLKVKDDKVMPAAPDDSGLAFVWDCLEFFFDGRPYGKRGGPVSKGADQVIVIPRATEKAEPCEFWFAEKDQAMVDIEFVGKKTADGYLLEGKITPREGSAVKLLPGDQFCMDFLIDDTDEPEIKRKAAMALHGIFNNNVDSSAWGRYQLAPAVH